MITDQGGDLMKTEQPRETLGIAAIIQMHMITDRGGAGDHMMVIRHHFRSSGICAIPDVCHMHHMRCRCQKFQPGVKIM